MPRYVASVVYSIDSIDRIGWQVPSIVLAAWRGTTGLVLLEINAFCWSIGISPRH